MGLVKSRQANGGEGPNKMSSGKHQLTTNVLMFGEGGEDGLYLNRGDTTSEEEMWSAVISEGGLWGHPNDGRREEENMES